MLTACGWAGVCLQKRNGRKRVEGLTVASIRGATRGIRVERTSTSLCRRRLRRVPTNRKSQFGTWPGSYCGQLRPAWGSWGCDLSARTLAVPVPTGSWTWSAMPPSGSAIGIIGAIIRKCLHVIRTAQVPRGTIVYVAAPGTTRRGMPPGSCR